MILTKEVSLENDTFSSQVAHTVIKLSLFTLYFKPKFNNRTMGIQHGLQTLSVKGEKISHNSMKIPVCDFCW